MSEALDINEPLRIEVSSSQIDGGQAVGWVDPALVLGCVAHCEPPAVFERFVLPYLENPENREDDHDQLPPVVSALIDSLKSIHLRLYRENHTLMKDPKWVRLTAAYADESRIYFVKSQTAWIYLIRGGQAYLIGENDLNQDLNQSKTAALGGKDKLQIHVTSLDISENDLVLLVTGESTLSPDLHAVSNLFSNSIDLKRACDGLVNLLGLQGDSAAVVAFRYTPILGGADDTGMSVTTGEDFLGEITEWARILSPDETTTAEEPAPRPDQPTQPILEIAKPAAKPDEFETKSLPTSKKLDESNPEEKETLTESSSLIDSSEEDQNNEFDFGDLESAESLPASQPPTNYRLRATVAWTVVAITLLVLASILFRGVGWSSLLEDAKQFFSQNRSADLTDYYLLDVTSEPPGAIVTIDGTKAAGRTPLNGLHVPDGKHLISMHLGLAGVWTDSIEHSAGDSESLHAEFIGSLEISAKDLNHNPRTWLAGQNGKVTLPAYFDSLPSGWYRVFFEDDNTPLWERKVLIRNGITSSIEINNVFSTNKALLHIEGLQISEVGRLRPSIGDSAFLNRRFVGLTPLELEVAPGLHGIQVTHEGESYQEILRLPAGASRFVTPQFGLRHFPSFFHRPPGQVVLQGAIFLAVEINSLRDGLRHPMLHLPDTPAGPQVLRMTRLDSGSNHYVGRVESSAVHLDDEIPYYFSITTPEGEEAVSELYRMRPVRETPEALDIVRD